MILDYQLSFADSQSLSGTSDTVSTNVYDAGSAKLLFGGGNNGVKIAVSVSAAGGTSPTFQAKFVGADDAALTTNPETIADTGVSPTIAASDLPLVYELRPGLQKTAKRYYGILFNQTGTSPTATASAAVAETVQTRMIK